MHALAAALLFLAQDHATEPLYSGRWSAWLDSPGGRLPFEIEVGLGDAGWFHRVWNGSNSFDIPRIEREGLSFTFHFDPYDSKIAAQLGSDGRHLDGEWTKRSGAELFTHLPFHATFPAGRLPRHSSEHFTGRWAVRFARSAEPAVAVLDEWTHRTRRYPPCGIQGTLLTTLGDYRYLSGGAEDGSHLVLSCFDGAHAFLFKAEMKPSGALEGDFWSGDAWHETWTAVRDDNAKLPDPFGLTKWNENASLDSISFPGVDGKPRALTEFPGRARMLVLFGTWCPNCNDEAAFLRELDQRYRERGLSIVGLAFELTGDFARDAKQVELYAKHHQLAFPLLVAGVSDKAEASKRFPLLDQVRAYPTTIFLHADGRVRAVHQGYSGPATGAEHVKLREDFERLIEELLAEGSKR